MGIKSIHNILLIFFILTGSLFSQGREYRLTLSKDNISWMWQGYLKFDQGRGTNNNFYIRNNFSSNLFKQTIQGNRWKDENNFNAYWQRRLSSDFSTATKIRSHVFSDENAFVKFSKHRVMQEVSYQPTQKLNIAPAVGWATEDIGSFQDKGWYTEMNLNVNNYDLGGYINNTDAFASYYFFPGRQNQEHKYFMSFKKAFSKFASDSFQIGYQFTQNSYPLSRQTHTSEVRQLEDVEINSRFLYNRLLYKFSDVSVINVETQLKNRDVSQSNPTLLNHRYELDVSNRINYRYLGNKIQSGISLLNSQVTNLASRTPTLGSETRNDSEGLQAALNLFFNWRMTPSDEARINFSYTKYEYSSPDTTQQIDEDDLRFIIDFSYAHRFSRFFKLRINANVYLYHQIYINASRSANNNWNRIFQLSPSFHQTIPGVLEHSNRIKILANYTVFDFEDILPQVRSYIYRKLVYSDSLSLHLSKGLKLATTYQLENEENGTFFKDIFAQQVSRELLSHFVDISLVYLRIKGLQFSSGINWYLRKEWRFIPEKQLVRNFRSFSPRITLLYNVGGKLVLHLTYSPKVYNDINTDRQYFETGRLNLKYLF